MQQRKSTLAADGGSWRAPRRCVPASISSELFDPGGELLAVEAQVLPELHVWDAVRARALVQPAHGHTEQRSRFLYREPRHHKLLSARHKLGWSVASSRCPFISCPGSGATVRALFLSVGKDAASLETEL